MMQYEHMRLMDAYMVCRARRLNGKVYMHDMTAVMS